METSDVIFFNLDDKVTKSNPAANSTYSIQGPAITLEKEAGVFKISARFKLHVEPYPCWLKEKNSEWIHARFIESIALRYTYCEGESHDYEPDAYEPDAYIVTESSGRQTSLELGLEGSAKGPSGNLKASIVKDGKIEWQRKFESWILLAGIEPISTFQTAHRYLWTWSTLSKPDIPIDASAFNGISRTIVVTRKIPEGKFPLKSGDEEMTPEQLEDLRKELRKLFYFKFNISTTMRRLGHGGWKAHLEKMGHWLRAYKSPIAAYNSVKNSGKNVSGLDDDFCLGPSSSNSITDEEIRDLRSKIPIPGKDTDAIEDARLQAEHVEKTTKVQAKYIATKDREKNAAQMLVPEGLDVLVLVGGRIGVFIATGRRSEPLMRPCIAWMPSETIDEDDAAWGQNELWLRGGEWTGLYFRSRRSPLPPSLSESSVTSSR
ncbi:hypothetical protein V502_01322 [Pseudogymnoascus sp. VKM F-4520 (FW-2644)]|nr:hypothetical protein V502_01322 [Pseudogymnoascus sp. VKM F-4520 (FW-2644)]